MSSFASPRGVAAEQFVARDAEPSPSDATHERYIGEIIRQTNQLNLEQIDQVLTYQKEKGMRFGEAAIALGFATGEDVLWALSQQFHYPYAADQRNHLNDELVLAKAPFSQRAEAFRAVRTQLVMRVFTPESGQRVLAVVSPDSGDGKTYFAANMAVALSQLGGRTLLIDADMRNPRQHEVFGIDNSSGLSNILSGRARVNVIRPVTELPSLFVLPLGPIPPNPLELLERPAFGLLLQELAAKFDYLVVDTPAFVHGSDASVIAARCGSALAIVRQGRSSVRITRELLDEIRQTPARLCGVVVNDH